MNEFVSVCVCEQFACVGFTCLCMCVNVRMFVCV